MKPKLKEEKIAQYKELNEEFSKLMSENYPKMQTGCIEWLNDHYKKIYKELEQFFKERELPFSVSRNIKSQTVNTKEDVKAIQCYATDVTVNFTIPLTYEFEKNVSQAIRDKINNIKIKMKRLENELTNN